MNKIKQYYEIAAIKPDYHKLNLPIHKPSQKKIILNGMELEL